MPSKPVKDLYAALPITDAAAKLLADDYTTIVNTALADRSDLTDRWDRAYKLYEGIRPERTFPWKGAANTHIPLVAIHASAIHARFMTTIFPGSDPVWRVRSRRPDYQDFATLATDYLEWARQNQFDAYPVIRDFAWDAIKFGLGVIKAGWLRRVETLMAYESKGGKFEIVQQDDVVTEDRPFIESIRPNRFVWPQGYDSVQACPWIAFINRMSEDEVQRAYDTGYFDRGRGIEKLCNVNVDHLDTVKAEGEGIVASTAQTLDVYEVWARRRIPSKGTPIVHMLIEPKSGTLLRYRLNPHFHRKYPVIIGRLEVREHSITGLGVADQIGDLNESTNTVHNQTIDATTVSICQMFGVRAGSLTEDALAEIYPGKRIPYTNPDDIKEIGLGPLKANSMPLEEQHRNYAERRTGISDFGLGREPTPSRRGTATGTLAIIQEGNKKFDYQVRDLREGLGELGGMLLSMIQQNNPQGVTAEVLGPDGQNFVPLNLVFPSDPVDRVVSVEVVAGSPSLNRQSQRQDALSLWQIMMGVYQQSINLGQLLQTTPSPAMQALYLQVARGAETMLKEVLNSFENRRAEEIIPDLQEIYNQIGMETMVMMQQMAGQQAQQPGQSGTEASGNGNPPPGTKPPGPTAGPNTAGDRSAPQSGGMAPQ